MLSISSRLSKPITRPTNVHEMKIFQTTRYEKKLSADFLIANVRKKTICIVPSDGIDFKCRFLIKKSLTVRMFENNFGLFWLLQLQRKLKLTDKSLRRLKCLPDNSSSDSSKLLIRKIWEHKTRTQLFADHAKKMTISTRWLLKWQQKNVLH